MAFKSADVLGVKLEVL